MSVLSMARVWESSQHAGSELLMLLAIADFSDDDGNAYPAVATLAAKCRMKPRNCQYILRALEESGELSIRTNKGPAGSNLYRINFGALGVQHSAGVQSLAGVQHRAPGGATQCAKGVQRVAYKPSVNHQEPLTRARKSTDDGFATFWHAYPKKVGKWAAEKAWSKLKPDLTAVLQSIERARATEQWRKDGGQFIPHPATWLNQRRWEDEPDTSTASAVVADSKPKTGDTRKRHGVEEVFTSGAGWVPA